MACSDADKQQEDSIEYWRTLATERGKELTRIKGILQRLCGRTELRLRIDELDRGIGTATENIVFLDVYDIAFDVKKAERVRKYLTVTGRKPFY